MKNRRRHKWEAGAPEAWRETVRSHCENCGRDAARCYLSVHHVVRRQHVEREGGDPWDVRNAMTLCDGPFSCHLRHHARLHVIPSYKVPAAAIEFAIDLFGAERAYSYLSREYLDAGTGRFDALLDAE